MDYQYFVDCVNMPCCVMSVGKTDEGTVGEIRIVCSNRAYRETMGPAYYDGMPYYELVPQDNKFEDYCFRAAILKQRMHAYVETRALNAWTDQTLIPLESESENLGYCQFIFEFTKGPEAERMATVSVNTAETVIEACIRLMGAEDFKTSIGDVLDVILRASGGKASRILLIDHDRKRAASFCSRMSADAKPVFADGAETITYDLILSWEAMIGESNAVIVKDEQDLELIREKNPEWAESMRLNRVESLVLLPLRRSKEVIGYLYVINFDVSKVVETKELVELMSFFLGSEIYNHLLLEKLEELSQIDTLTGINNRRAMSKCIERLNQRGGKTPFGVVNIDLNGLKTVNDHEGHEAGDRLLIQAGEILKKVFYQDDLFRTGGDEFIVISGDISRDTFERKLQRLRCDIEKNSGVSFAIGECWSDGSTDVISAFRLADEKMYADKKAFYDRNPELRRK